MKENELLFRFGQKLKNIRLAKGWTLRDLEACTDIDHGELSRFESGFVSPQLLTLYKVSQALGVTLSELLDIEKDVQIEK